MFGFTGSPSKEEQKESTEIALFVRNFLLDYFFAGSDEKMLSLRKELFESKIFEINISIEAFLESDLLTPDFLFEFAQKVKLTRVWLPEIAANKNIDDRTIAYLISSEMGYGTMHSLLLNKKVTREHAANIMKADLDYGFKAVAISRFAADLLEEFQKEINFENINRLIEESRRKKGETKTSVLKSKELKRDRLYQLSEILGDLLSNPIVPVSFLIDCIPIIVQLNKERFLRFYHGPSNSWRGTYVTLATVLKNPNLPTETLDALIVCSYEKKEICFNRIKDHPNYKQRPEARTV